MFGNDLTHVIMKLTEVYDEDIGSVLSGPVEADGYVWYKVLWDHSR